MSILDGLPKSEAEWRRLMDAAAPIAQRLIDELELSPKAQSILKLMSEGMALADICGLTQEERDAMFIRGCRMIQAGDVTKGRDWMLMLHQLEPLDARVIYAIALTYQGEGNIALAAKLYVHFIALDAANPEGHLRLGECLLSAREYDGAIAHFAVGERLSRGTNAAAAAHAVRMHAHALERRSAHQRLRQAAR
ncbi:hypothetical protein CO669_07670 [Bradyrhizobium sp. Y36]|uniref:hypothetical protein n=1 Tax=Bradyrhizobium sp. Y36 TaxID=2035447 RepID=UPI000BE80E17|nr:hypothetical protein [Bradyrhizobium sp. Y36]PDT90845.1 hypothetical protein CO669_07670 [Bradyrhizobium sp. Y36]